MLRPYLLLPPLAAALAATPAAAQDAATTAATSAAIAADSGMISGTVSDDDDAPLEGVSVRLECGCMAAPQERVTDSRGTFVFSNLAPGSYTLRAYPDSGAAIVHEAPLADGGLTELTVIVTAAEGPAPKKPSEGQAHRLSADRHAEDHDHHPKEIWGGVHIGLVFAPFRDQTPLSPETNRITADQLNPWSGAIRGIDMRWQTFDLDRHHFPRTIGYFRSGFRKGSITFDEGAAGQPTSLEALTVPLFFGGNLYLFRDFPVRPYAGLGAGFDVMRLAYQRGDAGAYRDVSLRIGFEVHGGIEVRISNYIAITGEVTQLWSARRKLNDLPDVSNESFTALLGVAGAFPMRR